MGLVGGVTHGIRRLGGLLVSSSRRARYKGRMCNSPHVEDRMRTFMTACVVGFCLFTSLGLSAEAGETKAKMEKAKGEVKGEIEEMKGETKAMQEELKGNEMKAELERAKGKVKGAGERAKGKFKEMKEKAKE